jgi:hypothetical protein
MRLALVLAIALLGCSSSHGSDPDSLGDDGNAMPASSARGSRAQPARDDGSDDVGSVLARRDGGTGPSDAGEPSDPTANDATAEAQAGRGAEMPSCSEPADGGTSFVCFAGSCTKCPSGEAGSSGAPTGHAGTGGQAALGGSAAPACPDGDADADGVCDSADACPGGSDGDADHNGYADGCDRLLASFTVPASTKSVDAVKSAVQGVFGSLNGYSLQLLDTPVTKTPMTLSMDIDGGESRIVTAAQKLQSESGTLSVALCVASSSPSNPCWRLTNQYSDMTSKTITRFVLVVDPIEIVANGTKTDVTTGGRWEIRGY